MMLKYLTPELVEALDALIGVANERAAQGSWAEQRGMVGSEPFTFLIAVGDGARKFEALLLRASLMRPPAPDPKDAKNAPT